MKRKIFILAPSPNPVGPVKGAYALANALATERDVTLVTLKRGRGVFAPLDKSIKVVSLADTKGGFIAKIRAYQQLLESSGARNKLASISLCLSADLVNLFCSHKAVICSSIRGNLIQNYRMDYGLPGIPLAIIHLVALTRFDCIAAMSSSMAKQIHRFSRRNAEIIGNFVDEDALELYRSHASASGQLRFVFLASLSNRKQPLLLIGAIRNLIHRGLDVKLDVIGIGPLKEKMLAEIERWNLSGAINLHGQMNDPYTMVAEAHAMVIPSLSEGISRAALESLYLGIPCVLRKADGNSELIEDGVNGFLFQNDDELADCMYKAARLLIDTDGTRRCLLPKEFRQKIAAGKYLDLVEKHD